MINQQNIPVLYVAPGKPGQAVKAAGGKSRQY
jgi:hypothetical protein